MRGYGQFCPVAKGAEVFCERWNALILRELCAGSVRYSDLQKGVPLMSPSLLSKRLKELETAGIVERRRSASGGSYEYHLTPAGRDLEPLVRMLGVWAQQWVDRSLPDEELDVGLLMWDMHRCVAPAGMGGAGYVVKFEYPELPQTKQHWWIVSDGAEAALCAVDPGAAIDLYVTTDLRTMTAVWRGDLETGAAVDGGRLDLHGAPAMIRDFRSWLTLSPFAGVARRGASASRVA